MPRFFLPFFALLFLQQTTFAQNTWTGATSTDWNTPSNWDGDAVPTASDDVIIGAAGFQPVINEMGAARSVEVLSGAVLTINNSGGLVLNGSSNSSLGCALYNEGTVNNSGQLVIGNLAGVGDFGIANFGSYIDGPATFNNYAGGTITIDRSEFTGLFSQTGSFTNGGTITIGAGGSAGFHGLENDDGTFDNIAGGSITIDNTSIYALRNFTGATFNNLGTITIGAAGSVGSIGVNTGGPFNNGNCAVLTSFAPLSNYGPFTNTGLFTLNTTGTHINDGFTNNGTLAYPQGNPAPNVTNQALIVLPLSGCSNTVTPALQAAPGNPFTIAAAWYKDAALTQTAGTYDAGSNSFTASGLNAGTTPVYFAVSNGSSCTQTVSIPFTLLPVPQLTSTPTAPAICNRATFSYTPTASLQGTTFAWKRQVVSGISNAAANGTGSISETLINTAASPVTVTYVYTLSNTEGCTSTANVVVTVYPSPVISCPSNFTVNPTSLSGAVVTYTEPKVMSSCSATTSRTAGPASGSTFPIGTTTVSYQARDAAGNTATCSFTVTVRNPYEDNKNQKVYVCHGGKTLSVGKASVQAHLGHGDQLGRCEWYTASGKGLAAGKSNTTLLQEEFFAAGAYPNPTKGAFTLAVNNARKESAQVLILDSKGSAAESRAVALQRGAQTLSFNLRGKAAGLYLVQLRTENGVQTFKVYLQP